MQKPRIGNSSGKEKGLTFSSELKIQQRLSFYRNFAQIMKTVSSTSKDVRAENEHGMRHLMHKFSNSFCKTKLKYCLMPLTNFSHPQLMVHYRLPEFQTVVQFLTLLAKRHGKLKKGGIPDRVLAARKVLHDWNM